MNIKKYYYSYDAEGKEHDESYKLETLDEKIIRLREEGCKELHILYYSVGSINKEDYMFTAIVKF